MLVRCWSERKSGFNWLYFRVSRIALFALVVVKVTATATTTVRPARAAASAPATVLRHRGSDVDAARTDTKVLWVLGMKHPPCSLLVTTCVIDYGSTPFLV